MLARDLKTETETIAAGPERKGASKTRVRLVLERDRDVAELVAAERRDAFLAEQPLTVGGHAVVQNQLNEARVVAGRRVQTPIPARR